MILLDGLRERGITLKADGDRLRLRGPADQITPDLRAELAAQKAEILAQLRQQGQAADVRPVNVGSDAQEPPLPARFHAESHADEVGTLEEHIRFARSEGELDDLVEQIQAGFETGHLSQAQAERLAALTMDTARQLARGLVNVPVGTL